VGVQSTLNPAPERLAGRSLAELAELFELADAPDPPLDGRYRGGLISTTFGAGLDPVLGRAFERTRPWLGKRFDAAARGGQNVLDRRLWGAGRLLTPHRYRAWWPEDDETFRAFPFGTSVGPSLLDPGHTVLQIDYDVDLNHPRLRRIRDELVEPEPGLYLGQALWRRAGGRRLAWFWLAAGD
jgi:hypothetical protein